MAAANRRQGAQSDSDFHRSVQQQQQQRAPMDLLMDAAGGDELLGVMLEDLPTGHYLVKGPQAGQQVPRQTAGQSCS